MNPRNSQLVGSEGVAGGQFTAIREKYFLFFILRRPREIDPVRPRLTLRQSQREQTLEATK